MIPAWFIILAVTIRLLSGTAYAIAVIKGRARPNPITWFFWALTPMIVFVAQVFDGIIWGAVMSFALGLGPLIIFLLSLKNNWTRAHFTLSTITCAICAAIGIILWLITDDPILAIIFSIAADIFGSIPTVIKAYKVPKSEVALPYFLSMISMVITLLATSEWRAASYAFPIYIFLINLLIFSLVYLRTGKITRALPANRLTAKGN